MATAYNTDFMKKNTNICYAMLSYQDDIQTVVLPCYPESLSDNVSPQWNTQQILGRTASIAAYTGTGDLTYGFSFKLHREMCDENSENSVEDVIRFLRKTVYPKYKQTGLLPPLTKFVFGQTAMSGYVTSFSATWEMPIINGLYQVCNITIALTSDPNKVYDSTDLGSSYNPFYVPIERGR